jgi:tetratricopeptide (TPR) repeat protein
MIQRSELCAVMVGALAVAFLAGCNNPHLAGGKLHFDQKRYERALSEFELAAKDMPESGEARLWLGRAHAELDQPELAAKSFDEALQLDPRIEADIKNAREHYWSERYNSAITSTKEADDLKAQGDTTAARGDFEKALADFQKALIYNPESISTRTNIGATEFNLGEIDKALEIFQEVRNMAPDNAEVKKTLHSVYVDQGNRSYNAAVDARDSQDTEKAKKMFEAARQFYAQAHDIDPDDIDLEHNRAVVAWELSDLDPENKQALLDEAQAAYTKVLEAEPDNTDVLENLSILYSNLGENEKALEFAQRLVDLDPKNGRYHTNEGRIQGEIGDKTAMFGDLLIGQALGQGMTQETSDARVEAEKWGPRSDELARFREGGPPEEIRVYVDPGGQQYDVWFYWSRGACYAFNQGKEIFSKRFKRVEIPEEEEQPEEQPATEGE